MPSISFSGVLIIALVAVAVPVRGRPGAPAARPGAVLEVVAGILIGPAVLGWVHLNASVQVLSDLGLGMLLFLAGLEIDIERLRGPLGRLAGRAFGGSVLLGLACGLSQPGRRWAPSRSSWRSCWSPPRPGCSCPCSKTPAKSSTPSASW